MQVTFKAKRNPNDKRLGIEKFNIYADYQVNLGGKVHDYSPKVAKSRVVTPEDREYDKEIYDRYKQGNQINKGK